MGGKNGYAKEQLKILYGCKCMLTGIKEKKKLTFHHIIKAEHGGPATANNGANLIGEIHSWLHCSIENNDPELFALINECLQLYKICLDLNEQRLIEHYEQECMPLFHEKYVLYKNKKRKR